LRIECPTKAAKSTKATPESVNCVKAIRRFHRRGTEAAEQEFSIKDTSKLGELCVSAVKYFFVVALPALCTWSTNPPVNYFSAFRNE
jgi:hypothetical protein